MKIFIRADADPAIGTGHIMRCLALAIELKHLGAQVSFISCKVPQALARLIGDNRFAIKKIGVAGQWRPEKDAALAIGVMEQSGGADLVIADRPGLDMQWDKAIGAHARLLVIDDLALVRRDCDILLNQNHLPGVENEYTEIMDASPSRFLMGPRYALLRREFAEARGARIRDGNVRRVLISFGGGEQGAPTVKTVRALASLCSPELVMDVVAGPASADSGELAELADKLPNVTLHINVTDMARLTVNADIAIGAFGVSTWERLCLGVPSIIITVAGVQERPAQALADGRYVIYLGRDEETTPQSIAKAVKDLSDNPVLVKFLSSQGMKLVDGLGARRTAQAAVSAQS